MASGRNKFLVRRKSRQNYLAYSQPFDLNKLLDEKYWKHKKSKFHHTDTQIKDLCTLNGKVQAGSFSDQPYHHFFNFQHQEEHDSFKVKNLYWQNDVDTANPYQSGFKDQIWCVSEILSFLLFYDYSLKRFQFLVHPVEHYHQ